MLDVKTKSKLFESLVDLLQKGSHVLNFSSVAVYGDSSSSRKEDDFPNPINSYGFRKLETEKELIDLAFPDLITNLRISNLFGLSSFEDFTNTAHATIRKGEILHIPKSVTYRDFIPVNRLFLFVEFWINSETKTGQILNFASGQSVSLRGWAGYIADTLKKPLNLRSDLNTDFSDSFIDNTLLSKIWTAHFVEPKLVLESYVVKGWID
jgi:nucleoside-diphosphate-sugar epimerase